MLNFKWLMIFCFSVSTIVSAAESPSQLSSQTASQATSKLTPQQQEAVKVAQSYMQTFDYSRKEIIRQVINEFETVEKYTERLSRRDAEIAIDSMNINWNEKALETANSYLETSVVSHDKLLQLLKGYIGDRFTNNQARYAMDNINVDWDLQSVRRAKEHLFFRNYSCKDMVDKLVIHDLFTVDQAIHGALMTGVCK